MAAEPIIFNGEPLILSLNPIVDDSCEGCCEGGWCQWGVYKDVANSVAVSNSTVGGGAYYPHTGVYTNTQKWYLVKCGVNNVGSVNSFPDFAVELPALGAASQTNSYTWGTPIWSTNSCVYVYSTEEPYVVKVNTGGSVAWTSDEIDSGPPGTGNGPYTGDASGTSVPGLFIVNGGSVVFDFEDTYVYEGTPQYRHEECVTWAAGFPGTYDCWNDPFRSLPEFYLDDSTGYITNEFHDEQPTDPLDANGDVISRGFGQTGPLWPTTTLIKCGTVTYDTEPQYPVGSFGGCFYTDTDDCETLNGPPVDSLAVAPTNQAPSITTSVVWDADDDDWQFNGSGILLINPTISLSGGLTRRLWTAFHLVAGTWGASTYSEDEVLGGSGAIFKNGPDIASGHTTRTDGYPYVWVHKTARGEVMVICPASPADIDAAVYMDGGQVNPDLGFNAWGGTPQTAIRLIDSSDIAIFCGGLYGSGPGNPLGFGILNYDGESIDSPCPGYLFVRTGDALIKLSSDRSSPTMYQEP
jgi:hypothetical protein